MHVGRENDGWNTSKMQEIGTNHFILTGHRWEKSFRALALVKVGREEGA